MATLCLRCTSRLFLRTVASPTSVAVRGAAQFDRPLYQQKPVPLNDQSVLMPGKDGIRASRLLDDPSELIGYIPGATHVKTVHDCIQHGFKASNDGQCLGTKLSSGEYKWESYSEVIRRAKNVGSALVKLGLEPSNDSYLGIFASNRAEFTITKFSTAFYSMVLVPLYHTLGLQSVLFIIAHANLSLVIVHEPEYVKNILENLEKVPSLKTMVLMDGLTQELTKSANEKKINIMTFEEMEELGQKNQKDLVLPSPESLFGIFYTSGTTGVPKGVMLRHRNVIACVSTLVTGYGEAGTFGGTILSYLPPAHIYEVCNQVASTFFGRRIAYYRGDIRDLLSEVRVVQPTILPLVPRLMTGIYMREMEKYKGKPIKSFLLKVAMAQKTKMLKKRKVYGSVWDKLLFKNFREGLGGKVHLITCTSAPIPADIIRFFRIATGCYIFEVYGQTELSGGTMTIPCEHTGGSVGPPMTCNYVKLVDVPEMGCYAKDGIGEICFKGYNVFQGYFKNPEATKESLIDGWQHTGDIGRWNPNGTLTIVDRKKHIFKLSQGEYIAPEKIEKVYSLSNMVLQIFVDGLSSQNYTVMLVVPEMISLKNWLELKGFKDSGNMSELLQRKDVRIAFLEELHKLGKMDGLNALEQARNITFILEPFSIANDLMTPTLKVRRNHARKVFEKTFLQMYEEGPLIKTMKQ